MGKYSDFPSQTPIGVRAGGGEGGCSPPKFWATQIFWAARENLGKASFLKTFPFFLNHYFEEINIFYFNLKLA